MLNNQTVAVVVPCFNEEQQILRVLETMPVFVDLVVVVNDASTDHTAAVVRDFMVRDPAEALPLKERTPEGTEDTGYGRAKKLARTLQAESDALFPAFTEESGPRGRVVLLSLKENGGKGRAMAAGLKYARDRRVACTAVMDGDGQMDPGELESVCRPVLEGRADYCKGNRFKHRAAKLAIPRERYTGNAMLTLLTKIATGYWRISDAQTGFIAAHLEVLDNLDLHALYPRYGVHNDLLQKLNIGNFVITEVPITPHYHIGERSKMQIPRVAPKMAGLLLRLFFQRLFRKYLVTSFHPLFLLYFFGIFSSLLNIPLLARLVYHYFASHGDVYYAHLILVTNISIFGFQSLVFAMWFDMNDNDRLYV